MTPNNEEFGRRHVSDELAQKKCVFLHPTVYVSAPTVSCWNPQGGEAKRHSHVWKEGRGGERCEIRVGHAGWRPWQARKEGDIDADRKGTLTSKE